MNLSFTVPIKLAVGLNNREHWAAAHRRVLKERQAVWACFPRRKMPEAWPMPIYVRLTRTSPRVRPMDFDNLVGSLKGIRDAVAWLLNVDDGDESRIRFTYARETGPWGVIVDLRDAVEEATKGAWQDLQPDIERFKKDPFP